jgi:hypothetical protein
MFEFYHHEPNHQRAHVLGGFCLHYEAENFRTQRKTRNVNHSTFTVYQSKQRAMSQGDQQHMESVAARNLQHAGAPFHHCTFPFSHYRLEAKPAVQRFSSPDDGT